MNKSDSIAELAAALAKAQGQMENARKDAANPFFVYAHQTLDGEVFYVGKGSGIRQHQTGNRTDGWKKIAHQRGYTSIILESNLTEQEAYNKEIEWISYYKTQGLCKANVTDGGIGVRVAKRWWGDKISQSLRGQTRPRGKDSKQYKDTVSMETLINLYVEAGLSSVEIAKQCGLSYTTVIARLRDYGINVRSAGRSNICIRCITDGKDFPSVNEAARYYGVFRENIRKVLHGQYRHTGGRVFAYVGDTEVAQ